ncbi:MAG: hypothetical protein ACTSWN_00110 [Promethearchaeota archaeon]
MEKLNAEHSQELKVMEMLFRFNNKANSYVAFIPPAIFKKLKEMDVQFILLKHENHSLILQMKMLPSWDPHHAHNIIRLHSYSRDSLGVNTGEFCRIFPVKTLPTLDKILIRISGMKSVPHEKIKIALKKFFIGFPVMENTKFKIPVGFCQNLEFKFLKAYPFAKGIINNDTELELMN